MSSLTALPTAPGHFPPGMRRRAPLTSEQRSILIGIFGTLLVHVLLLWLLPRLDLGSSVPAPGGVMALEAGGEVFELQIVPTPSVATEPPQPPEFVETNPAAPDNTPDTTVFFGANNQQAAQPIPTPNSTSPTPAVRGDPDRPSTAIVTGNLAEPRPLPIVTPPQPATTPQTTPARKPQTPLAGTEELRGTAPTPGSSVAEAGPNPAPVTERVEGNPAATASNQFTIGLPVQVDPLKPRPRPTVTSQALSDVRSAPLLNNLIGSDRTGLTAYDAKWSPFGEYLQRFINTVEAQWYRIVAQSALYPERGTHVKVVFRMNSHGEIAEILSVTSNGNRDAQASCVSAITARSPYGEWSADMVTQLGESQELTLSFYYN